jgi:hypothetical protein
VHHNVLRDLITPTDGQAFTPPALFEEEVVTLNFTLNGAWNADECYVLAWVRNADTKEILNSGTRFDPVVVSTVSPVIESVSVRPNPATDAVWVTVGTEKVRDVQLFGADGRLYRTAFSAENEQVRLDVANLPAGVYTFRLLGETKTFAGKMIKQD